ncbi:MFS transporter [Arthrobacter sp. NicSoilB8]|uniref:MFS transporter n=1 Tax=Arthrobacter sp. NicSoilB8 TaxID=2830998 RepID=UPI001CC793DB|nr:MFS transporter [Arthrobacter sp. NicSoilB8]BCW70730.1 MFS transporter [Arthrobacter sp. NicSoilB8]
MTQSTFVEARSGRNTSIVALLLLSGITLDIQYGILAPLVGVIATESGLSGPEIGWVLNALMIGSVISVGLTAPMGDIYGHRKVLIALIALALVGCALAAIAHGFLPLVIGRFLMGLAVAIPLSWGLLRPRGTARQIRLVSLGLSTVMTFFVPLALIVGGAIVELGLPWESVFWVIFALYAVMLILAFVSPETPASARAVVRLDWFGALGLGIWVTAMLIGISEGPALGWTSPIVLGAFFLSAVTLAAWIIQQRRTQEPLVSFRNMDLRQTLIGYSGILLISLVGQGLFIVLPALLQTPTSSGFGHGLSALESSYVLLALIPGGALGYLWTRWGITRLGPKTVLVVSGTASIGVFLGLAFASDQVWMPWMWVFGYALTTLSCITTGYTLVASAGRQDNMAVTIGMQNIVQFLGAMIAVAIVLNVLVPGADGYIPEATFIGFYVASALVVALFVIVWAFLAPKHITDRHAIDTEADPVKVHAAAP